MEQKKILRTITRKDIAIEAGVTETIVSYVINGNRYVKEVSTSASLSVK